ISPRAGQARSAGRPAIGASLIDRQAAPCLSALAPPPALLRLDVEAGHPFQNPVIAGRETVMAAAQSPSSLRALPERIFARSASVRSSLANASSVLGNEIWGKSDAISTWSTPTLRIVQTYSASIGESAARITLAEMSK